MNTYCETCIFWQIQQKSDYYGLCTNPKNYPIRTVYNDTCLNHTAAADKPVEEKDYRYYYGFPYVP